MCFGIYLGFILGCIWDFWMYFEMRLQMYFEMCFAIDLGFQDVFGMDPGIYLGFGDGFGLCLGCTTHPELGSLSSMPKSRLPAGSGGRGAALGMPGVPEFPFCCRTRRRRSSSCPSCSAPAAPRPWWSTCSVAPA